MMLNKNIIVRSIMQGSLVSSSYCYAVRGNLFENDIFSEHYIFHPTSNVANNCKPTYNTFLAYIPGYVSKLHICYNDESLFKLF